MSITTTYAPGSKCKGSGRDYLSPPRTDGPMICNKCWGTGKESSGTMKAKDVPPVVPLQSDYVMVSKSLYEARTNELATLRAEIERLRAAWALMPEGCSIAHVNPAEWPGEWECSAPHPVQGEEYARALTEYADTPEEAVRLWVEARAKIESGGEEMTLIATMTTRKCTRCKCAIDGAAILAYPPGTNDAKEGDEDAYHADCYTFAWHDLLVPLRIENAALKAKLKPPVDDGYDRVVQAAYSEDPDAYDRENTIYLERCERMGKYKAYVKRVWENENTALSFDQWSRDILGSDKYTV